jgi:hypothetical protein
MTDLITEARELCEKATPGPWEATFGMDCRAFIKTPNEDSDFKLYNHADAAFIARSRTLIPELCDALEKAEAENKQLIREVSELACESVEREKALARLEAEVGARLKELKE